MTRTAIGVDIGGTNIRAARVTQDGQIVARASLASSPDPMVVCERVLALVRQVDDGDALAIGVGVPGRVQFESRTVLSGGYVNLASVDLAAMLDQAFGRPVVLDNDCSMALVGEARFGAARGRANVVMLTIGTGIGGAIFESGRILRSRGTAGQLGHVTVDPHGLACACGRRGCVETESSGTALGRHIAQAGLPRSTSADALLELAQTGDGVAQTVLSKWAAPLRVAIDTLAATLDPDVVILGGGLGRAAARALQRVAATPSWYECAVAPALLGDDAGAIGAALAALDAVPRPLGKRAVLVNGIPASGKSSVSRALSQATGWPVLALDTVKNPFLKELGGADRLFNRRLGKASYEAIFALIAAAPQGTTVIVDAWFGFQPQDVLEAHLAMAGISQTIEIWCHAPGPVLAERYGARLTDRPAGHPGADYIPELIALADRARPLDRGPRLDVDTTTTLDATGLMQAVRAIWPS